ncbi:MAG: response regulator transcription factor, partial [Eubacteriales bacterium]|nr:response regulator transcription factor [Eubacteriales bacterium]
AGADDYVTKPFSVQAFLARIRMHLRREERYKNKSQALTFGALTICPDSQSVWIEDHEIQLTKREFVIVLMLAGRTGKVFSIEEIYDRVYPQSANTQFRSISEYIYQIRSKFRIYGINPIETMRGGGYRWKISSASTN